MMTSEKSRGLGKYIIPTIIVLLAVLLAVSFLFPITTTQRGIQITLGVLFVFLLILRFLDYRSGPIMAEPKQKGNQEIRQKIKEEPTFRRDRQRQMLLFVGICLLVIGIFLIAYGDTLPKDIGVFTRTSSEVKKGDTNLTILTGIVLSGISSLSIILGLFTKTKP